MIRKQTITIETQDFVYVAVLKHGESKIWRNYSEIQVFEDLDKAKEWATKECHRLLNNMVQKMGLMPNSSNVRWFNDCVLEMCLCDENGEIFDATEVSIYKKDIQ